MPGAYLFAVQFRLKRFVDDTFRLVVNEAHTGALTGATRLGSGFIENASHGK
jgi:hypothetical protein